MNVTAPPARRRGWFVLAALLLGATLSGCSEPATNDEITKLLPELKASMKYGATYEKSVRGLEDLVETVTALHAKGVPIAELDFDRLSPEMGYTSTVPASSFVMFSGSMSPVVAVNPQKDKMLAASYAGDGVCLYAVVEIVKNKVQVRRGASLPVACSAQGVDAKAMWSTDETWPTIDKIRAAFPGSAAGTSQPTGSNGEGWAVRWVPEPENIDEDVDLSPVGADDVANDASTP